MEAQSLEKLELFKMSILSRKSKNKFRIGVSRKSFLQLKLIISTRAIKIRSKCDISMIQLTTLMGLFSSTQGTKEKSGISTTTQVSWRRPLQKNSGPLLYLLSIGTTENQCLSATPAMSWRIWSFSQSKTFLRTIWAWLKNWRQTTPKISQPSYLGDRMEECLQRGCEWNTHR